MNKPELQVGYCPLCIIYQEKIAGLKYTNAQRYVDIGPTARGYIHGQQDATERKGEVIPQLLIDRLLKVAVDVRVLLQDYEMDDKEEYFALCDILDKIAEASKP